MWPPTEIERLILMLEEADEAAREAGLHETAYFITMALIDARSRSDPGNDKEPTTRLPVPLN